MWPCFSGRAPTFLRARFWIVRTRFRKPSLTFVSGNCCILCNRPLLISGTDELQLLDRLKSVSEANYDPEHGCLEGTRSKFLNTVIAKLRSVSNDPLACWVHGVAGTGKSTISATVADRLDKAGLLGGCFMFKRDIPELRDPRRVLPTLSRSLAQIYAPYRKHVLTGKGSPNIILMTTFGCSLWAREWTLEHTHVSGWVGTLPSIIMLWHSPGAYFDRFNATRA